ncbi:fused MFS/spermidine synthase [Aliikangiella sp. IMCC44359]|uniref:fused MFS/spermidine synthase n=1 Tax=Aliikangiella sp. IMCC44359 TaxID=3459125 RepID=UPI00403B2039
MSTSSVSKLKITLFCIFALSGFSGLIYESIWTHYIKLILGHAAYSQTLVLSIFMGGMAIGAALTGRRKDKPLKTPLKYYAIVEGILAIFAFGFHTIFVSTESLLHETLIPSIDSVVLIEIVRWGLASLLILPQSVLLGTTFPLIGTAVIRLDQQHSGSTLGMLYFTNSIGAAIGVLASGFILIGMVGLPGTIMTAGIINIFIAIIVWGLSKSERQPENLAVAEETPTPTQKIENQDDFSPNWLFAIALLTGLASFFYEIGWIRMLSLVLGSSMQAFELMLSAFITGIALGGLWIRKRISKADNPAFLLGKIQIIMGLCAVATLPLYNQMFDFMGFMINSLTKTEGGYLLFNLSSHFISMLIMLPASFMAGMTLPLITFTLLKWKQGEASIGKVYAFNTVGAIVGILIAIHIAMPLIGTKGLIVTGAIIDIGLGLFLTLRFMKDKSKLQIRLMVTSSIVIFLFLTLKTQFDPLTLSSGVFRHGETNNLESANVLFYQDGKTASISVIEEKSGNRVIITNGKPDAAIAPPDQEHSMDEDTMMLLAAMPLVIHPKAKKLANIGMGSGLTTHTLMSSAELTSVNTIEIEPAIVKGIQHFGQSTEKALVDPRSHITIDDAKSFFSRNKTKYDIIISEPSNPWVSGVAGLFSKEFYHHVNRYLNDDGIFVQWLQLYETNFDLVTSVFKALGNNFADYAVYSSNYGDIIIVASNGRNITEISYPSFKQSALSKQLQRINIENIENFSSRLIATKALLHPLFELSNAPINSDYFPYLGLNSPKARYLRQDSFALTELQKAPFPPARLIKQLTNKESIGSQHLSPISRDKAIKIANYFLDEKHENTDLTLGAPIILIKQSLIDCKNTAQKLSIINNGLHILATNTLPFIDNNKVKELWRYINNNPCKSDWPEKTNLWSQLYTAIALENDATVIRLSHQLFVNYPPTQPNLAIFLLGATTNSYIKQGKIIEAIAFKKEILNRMQVKGKLVLPLYIKILFSQLEYYEKTQTNKN